MAPNGFKLNAVAFISPQNHPILIRAFSKQDEHSIKYHYIAHTSLDVIEERGAWSHRISRSTESLNVFFPVNAGGKATECYLGLLYAMEDVAVYGYITPLKVKIVLALALSDSVVRDVEITMVCHVPSSTAVCPSNLASPDFQSAAHGLLFCHLKPILETQRTN